MIRKLLVLASVTLAAGVLAPTAVITHKYIMPPHQLKGWEDWFTVLLPLVPLVLALLSSLLLWRIQRRGPVGKGLVWGAFVSCALFMVLQASILSTQFTLISEDGEAYWVMLQLPAFWIALPLLLTGLVIGAISGWIRRKILLNKASEAPSGSTPRVSPSAPQD